MPYTVWHTVGVVLKFIWDEKKAALNLKKHGVGFEEAQTCFLDPLHIVIEDPDHITTKAKRMILMGMSTKKRILVVVHIEFEDNEIIRIISARKATKKERNEYEELL